MWQVGCHGESAVDGRVCAGDEGRGVGGEEHDEPCDLLCLPDPTQRVHGTHAPVELQQRCVHTCDCTRTAS